MKQSKFTENKIVITDEQGEQQTYLLNKNPLLSLGQVFLRFENQYYFLK